MTCQITYLPFGETDTIKAVEDVLDFLMKFDLKVDVHDLSTTVKGDTNEMFQMLRNIYDRQSEEGRLFRLHVEMLHTPEN